MLQNAPQIKSSLNASIYYLLIDFVELYHYTSNMIYLLFSTLAFLCLLVSDYFQISQKRLVVIPFSIAGDGGIVLVIIAMTIRYWVPTESVSFLLLKCFLVFLSLAALVYILFVEIPLSPQIQESSERFVVNTGTYALVRHPAFYPFILILVSLSFLAWDRAFIQYSLYLILLDFLLILVEDLFVFPGIFANYDIYKSKVPFLIPRKLRT
jgi:protein-S-isoprenylcysteine O-methyltransferase Ste14